jgi:molybdopterin-containing oxidoreductase family iron-sulfur binding subunit
VDFIEPVETGIAQRAASLGELVDDLDQGAVETLLILSGNPVFTAPANFDFAMRMKRATLRIHLSTYEDETSELCHWHIPEAHFLETWSDARAFDGTASIVQPLIAPLYSGKSAHEMLSVLLDATERPGHEIVKEYWKNFWAGKSNSCPAVTAVGEQETAREQKTWEDWWQQSLHDGVIADTAFVPRRMELQPSAFTAVPVTTPPAKQDLEIVFRPDPTIYDGRFANNGWLQELPKPLTKLTWDNAAMISPATAEKFGLSTRASGHGGEHGEALADMVELHYRGRRLEVPIWIMPGQPENTVTLHLGYGRTHAGKLGEGTGFNAYRLRDSNAPWFDDSLEMAKIERQYPLACTQYHHQMENRRLLRAGSLQQFEQDPFFAADESGDNEGAADKGHAEAPPTLYLPQEFPYEGYKWGMVIDLSACVGCNACITACQAENNIPVVGKEQVTFGREMHWLRVDRYFEGELDNPRIEFQPVPCMQCENAPCELVCPVGATVHSSEGLNDMVYNRCVGTRYCSNNCPYKVRRFNFLQYSDYTTESLKLLHNPEVTVRSRGVMEKCTYCVQRITSAKIDAEKQLRHVRDGEILTACQAACPAQAIVFGDLNDPQSQVAKWQRGALNYTLLSELNTQPRTSYLAALRNPNLQIETS